MPFWLAARVGQTRHESGSIAYRVPGLLFSFFATRIVHSRFQWRSAEILHRLFHPVSILVLKDLVIDSQLG